MLPRPTHPRTHACQGVHVQTRQQPDSQTARLVITPPYRKWTSSQCSIRPPTRLRPAPADGLNDYGAIQSIIPADQPLSCAVIFPSSPGAATSPDSWTTDNSGPAANVVSNCNWNGKNPVQLRATKLCDCATVRLCDCTTVRLHM